MTTVVRYGYDATATWTRLRADDYGDRVAAVVRAIARRERAAVVACHWDGSAADDSYALWEMWLGRHLRRGGSEITRQITVTIYADRTP